MERNPEIEPEIEVSQKVMNALKILRDSGATGPDLARSLRDLEGTQIEYAEVALKQIGFNTARTEDEPNKLTVLVTRGDSFAIHPKSEIIDWEENS